MKPRRAAASALGSLVLVGVVTVPSPASGAETCRGVPVTVVDDGGSGVLVGTEGPDVIVAHDRGVDALGGDDLICDGGNFVIVDAGPGDDVVDVTEANSRSDVILGDGDDTFYGGPADDWVADGTVSDGPVPLPEGSDVDVIRTGGGSDFVGSGNTSAANHDRIFLGPGNDNLSIVPTASDGSVDVGGGNNRLHLLLWATTEQTWTVDAVEQTVTHGAELMRWEGSVVGFGADTTDTTPSPALVFQGTPGDDSLSFALNVAYPRVTARFRGGDDLLFVEGRTAPDSSYLFGSGRDELVLNPDDGSGSGPAMPTVRMDLAQGRLDFGTSAAAAVIRGVEDLDVSGKAVKIVGSEAGERFTVNACRILVRAGAGTDVVRRGATGLGRCQDGLGRLEGGRGRDELIGQPRTDEVLIGGRGVDFAGGGKGGFDRCQAEVMRECERVIR